jgi:hypothetical protein
VPDVFGTPVRTVWSCRGILRALRRDAEAWYRRPADLCLRSVRADQEGEVDGGCVELHEADHTDERPVWPSTSASRPFRSARASNKHRARTRDRCVSYPRASTSAVTATGPPRPCPRRPRAMFSRARTTGPHSARDGGRGRRSRPLDAHPDRADRRSNRSQSVQSGWAGQTMTIQQCSRPTPAPRNASRRVRMLASSAPSRNRPPAGAAVCGTR